MESSCERPLAIRHFNSLQCVTKNLQCGLVRGSLSRKLSRQPHILFRVSSSPFLYFERQHRILYFYWNRWKRLSSSTPGRGQEEISMDCSPLPPPLALPLLFAQKKTCRRKSGRVTYEVTMFDACLRCSPTVYFKNQCPSNLFLFPVTFGAGSVSPLCTCLWCKFETVLQLENDPYRTMKRVRHVVYRQCKAHRALVLEVVMAQLVFICDNSRCCRHQEFRSV